MSHTFNTRVLICALLVLSLAVKTARAQTPLGTEFTFQGQLKDAGSPANGDFNMVFTLWDDPAAGNPVGPTLVFNGILNPLVSVANGLFTVQLDFGAASYNGEKRWLEISVSGVPLAPRQELTAAPYARFSAAPWATSGSDISFSPGNVGIGVSNPSALLHVGTSQAFGNSATLGISMRSSDAVGLSLRGVGGAQTPCFNSAIRAAIARTSGCPQPATCI